jgi:hypothetical protein
LQAVRALRSHENAVKKDKQSKLEDSFTKYRDTIGREALEQVLLEIPCLTEVKDALRPIPSPRCSPCFEYTPASASNATNSLSWMASQQKRAGTKVGQAVLDKYLREHDMIKHANCPKIPQQIDPVDETADCASAGICVHQGDGLVLKHQCNRLLQAMKAQAPVGSTVRKQMDEGQIVLRLSGEVRDGGDPDRLELYVHIGLMYWSPYRPTFHKVERIEYDESLPPNPCRFYVQVASRIVAFITMPLVVYPYQACPLCCVVRIDRSD